MSSFEFSDLPAANDTPQSRARNAALLDTLLSIQAELHKIKAQLTEIMASSQRAR